MSATVPVSDPHHLKTPAGVVAFLAPITAVLTAAIIVLYLPESRTPVFPRDGGTWVLALVGLVSAVEASVLVWRGTHGGELMPFKLLAWAVVPWGAGIMVALLRTGAGPAAVNHAEGGRLTGAFLSWALLAATGLSLALDAYAATQTPRHPRRAVIGGASVLPLAGFAVATALSAGLGTIGVVASLATIGMIVVVGLAAATGDGRPSWTVAVPVALGLSFVASGTVMMGSEAIRAFAAAGGTTEAAARGLVALSAAARFRGVGAVLALVPIVVLGFWSYRGRFALGIREHRLTRVAGIAVLIVAVDTVAGGSSRAELRRLATPSAAVADAGAPVDDSMAFMESRAVLMSRAPAVVPTGVLRPGDSMTVVLRAELDEHGVVIGARALTGPPLLRVSAESVVASWRFRPAMRGRAAVPSEEILTVGFRGNDR
jgi:hypothetical protein